MNVHIASVHEETKPFECHICNACFVNLNVLIGLVNEIENILNVILVRLVLLHTSSVPEGKMPSNTTNVILAIR